MNKSTLKKWLSVVLAFVLCLPLFAFTSGDGTYENPYEIAGASDIVNLIDMVSTNDCSGLYFLQTADIDLTPFGNFQGIGSISSDLTTTNAFSGNYDGDGYWISNMFINATLGSNEGCLHYGFFTTAKGATLSNIKVQGSIKVISTATEGTTFIIGGVIAGVHNNCVLEALENHCDIYCESVKRLSSNCGGVIGYAYFPANLTWVGLKNYGNIYTATAAGGLGILTSGILGSGSKNGFNNGTFLSCENHGKIVALSNTNNHPQGSCAISGIAYLSTSGKISLQQCINYTDIVVSGGCWTAAGVFNTSQNNSNPSLTSCANYGNIYLRDGDGNQQGFYGIVGGVAANGGNVIACTNAGNIYIEGKVAGRYEISGIQGHGGYYSETHAQNCVNLGDITYIGTSTSGKEEVSIGGITASRVSVYDTNYGNTSSCNYGKLLISTINPNSSSKLGIGGIGATYVSGDSYIHRVFYNNCVNFGELEIITPSNFAGLADISGVAAAASETKNDVKINWCYNLGKIKWNGKNIHIGGLMGIEEATTASTEYTHIDHSYSICSYIGETNGNYVGSVCGSVIGTAAPITISNSFGVAINRKDISSFAVFQSAYTNNVKGYTYSELYNDVSIPNGFLPSAKFADGYKSSNTYWQIIAPRNTSIFSTETAEAKSLHDVLKVNGYKRYITTIQQ